MTGTMQTKILMAVTISLLISTIIVSQDLIVKRDSSKIYCKITKEDSLTIFYKPSREKQNTELSINKSDVIKYFNSTTIAKEKKTKIDTAQRIWQAKELKKGFYKSSTEYITNSPSIIKDFVVIQRTQADLMFMHGSEFTYKVSDGSVDNDEVYGFCDGKDVYINYDHPKGYCKMEYIGPYTFFTYVIHATGALALIPDQLMIIDENGKFQDATPRYLKKVLTAKYPELAAKYEEEKEPKAKRKEYIIKLNEFIKAKQ